MLGYPGARGRSKEVISMKNNTKTHGDDNDYSLYFFSDLGAPFVSHLTVQGGFLLCFVGHVTEERVDQFNTPGNSWRNPYDNSAPFKVGGFPTW